VARRAVFTIVAKNYLAFARTLSDSLRQFHSDIDFHVAVVDMPGFRSGEIDKAFVSVLDPLLVMSGDQFNSMAKRYNVTELSTSMKPFVFRHLIDCGYDQILYFDPDILILQPLHDIFAALDDANIVLTPHLLEPIPMDGRLPDEPFILKAGAYNLGFVGLRATAESRRFLNWWSERLETLCMISVRRGLFVDQKWIDLVPGLFDGVTLLKYPGYNVAYWNLHSRKLIAEGGRYYVRDRNTPLVFFHFSGFKSDMPESLSIHQNRIDLSHEPVLGGLLKFYAELLRTNGHEACSKLPFTPRAPGGVNIAGYLTATLGVGEAARGYVRSVKNIGLNVSLYDFEKGTPSRAKDTSLSNFSRDNSHPINLICVNADQVEKFVAHVGNAYIREKTNIGVWWWELPKFPAIWKESFAYFDQIWVGSEFARRAVQAATPIPVVRIPPVVEVLLEKRYTKNEFGLDPNEFVFLYVFDILSVFERKNPIALVRAFKRAFSADQSVRLVLKCINEASDPANMQRLEQEIGDARITVLSGHLSKNKKNGLIDAADCFISLHRSEGFGYTMAEAMYLGKPVIATGWSGNMDFMSERNSYLVNYRLITIDVDHGPYQKGQTWAEPDTEHAASLMRRVLEERAEATMKGVQAAADIRANHSAAAVGAFIRKQLYDLPIPHTSKKRRLVNWLKLLLKDLPIRKSLKKRRLMKWLGRHLNVS